MSHPQGCDASVRKGSVMLQLLMRPANAVCDLLNMSDENERGMVRMLVNMMLLTMLFVVAAIVAFGAII